MKLINELIGMNQKQPQQRFAPSQTGQGQRMLVRVEAANEDGDVARLGRCRGHIGTRLNSGELGRLADRERPWHWSERACNSGSWRGWPWPVALLKLQKQRERKNSGTDREKDRRKKDEREGTQFRPALTGGEDGLRARRWGELLWLVGLWRLGGAGARQRLLWCSVEAAGEARRSAEMGAPCRRERHGQREPVEGDRAPLLVLPCAGR